MEDILDQTVQGKNNPEENARAKGFTKDFVAKE